MSSYLELLDDPRWKKRAAEIREKQNWRCRGCHTYDKLYVHHMRYIAGLAPWEYPDEYLVALCFECHKAAHQGRYLEVLEGGGEWGGGHQEEGKLPPRDEVFLKILKKFSSRWRKNESEAAFGTGGVNHGA